MFESPQTEPLLLPEYIKPVVTRWSETSCLAHKPPQPGFLPAAACGLPWRIHAEDCVWFCARAGTQGKGASGTLALKKRLPNVPCLYFITVRFFRSIRKVSRARSKWCPCCCCLCWDILGAETFSALPILVLIAPLWGVPLIVVLGTLKEAGTSHVTRADTRHQEE